MKTLADIFGGSEHNLFSPIPDAQRHICCAGDLIARNLISICRGIVIGSTGLHEQFEDLVGGVEICVEICAGLQNNRMIGVHCVLTSIRIDAHGTQMETPIPVRGFIRVGDVLPVGVAAGQTVRAKHNLRRPIL